jgi:thioredoxin reductase
MDAERRFDVVVLGAGPAGLSAALMLGRACRSVLVLDSAMPRNRFASHMHGVLGHDGRPPSDLLQDGRREVRGYGGVIETLAVDAVHQVPDGFVIVAGSQQFRGRRLVVATGLTDELPQVPGLAARWGAGVSHCPYCDGYEVRNQPLGVLATGHGSGHQAQLLRQWSDSLTYFADDRDELTDRERAELAARGIDVEQAPVAELAPHRQGVRVVLRDGTVRTVARLFVVPHVRPNDAVLVALGAQRITPHRISFVTVDHAGRTSVPGVWAVGNVVDPKANVPMCIGAGAAAGGAINADLVDEEVAAAASRATPPEGQRHG